MYKTIFICILLLVGMTSCDFLKGSGKVSTENREVSGFNKVSLSGIGDLEISQGSTESLSIEAEDNIIPKITTDVKDGTLEIGFDSKVWNILPTRPVKFHLVMNQLNKVDTSGAGSVTVKDLETDTLEINVSGTGNVSMANLAANTLTINIAGLGNFDVSGNVNSQQVTINGAGRYQAGDLQSKSAKIVVNGGGGATVWVTDTLDVQVAGIGGVDYYGHPNVTPNITGAGKVTELGDHK